MLFLAIELGRPLFLEGEPGAGNGAEDVWAAYERADLDALSDGSSRSEFMLRFTISHPALSTTIEPPSRLTYSFTMAKPRPEWRPSVPRDVSER